MICPKCGMQNDFSNLSFIDDIPNCPKCRYDGFFWDSYLLYDENGEIEDKAFFISY